MLSISAQLIAVFFVHIRLHTQTISTIPFFIAWSSFLIEMSAEVSVSYGSYMLLNTVGGSQPIAALITCHSEIIIVASE